MKIILFLLIYFSLIINIAKSFIIIIDYNSKLEYNNYECGGSIDLNDEKQYNPCRNFSDAGERSRQILKNKNNKNTELIFYIVKNENTIIDSFYFGEIDYFENIKFQIIDNSKDKNIYNFENQEYQIVIDGSNLIFNHVVFTSNYKNNENKNQHIEIGSGFKFKNFNSNYVMAIDSKSCSITINNSYFYATERMVGLFNIRNSSLDYYLFENMIFNNCIFQKFIYNFNYFEVKNLIYSNCKFFQFQSVFIIQGNSEFLKVNNCLFQNNNQSEYMAVFKVMNTNGIVIIENCKFINNIISTFLFGGHPMNSGLLNISISNTIYSNNLIKQMSSGYWNYFFNLYQLKDGYNFKIKDVIFERTFNDTDNPPGGFIYSSTGRGIYTFENLKIKNYSFDYYMQLNNCTITFINTPIFNTINGENNIIINRDNGDNQDNKIYLIIIIPTIMCILSIILILVIIIFIKKKIININHIFKNHKKNNKYNEKERNNKNNMKITDYFNYGSTDNITTISDSLSCTNLDDNSSAIAVD